MFGLRRRTSRSRLRLGALGLWLAVGWAGVLPVAAQAAEPLWQIAGADPERGRALIQPFGCGGCHSVPGVDGAHGNVGPPLDRIGSRTFIAGMLTNVPQNMLRWLRDPQSVVPGNAMPDVGLSEAQARDVAAFLYTLR